MFYVINGGIVTFFIFRNLEKREKTSKIKKVFHAIKISTMIPIIFYELMFVGIVLWYFILIMFWDSRSSAELTEVLRGNVMM